jgi:hypothetical protein
MCRERLEHRHGDLRGSEFSACLALASATRFAAGDRLGIVNEDPADATLAGVSLTFSGTRGS